MRFPRPGRLVVAATVSAALLPAGPAGAAPVKGLQDQEMTVNVPGLTGAFYTDARAAKVGMLRFNTSWDGRATAPDAGQVARIRAAIEQGVARGIRSVEIAPNISGDASFNPRGRRKGPTAASKVSSRSYTTYIRALAESLDGTGARLYYAPINEPNWYRHIPKRGGAALYRKLHGIAYTQVKRVSSRNRVLFGELLPYDRPLSRNYPNGQSTDAGTFTRQVLGLTSRWKARGSRRTHTVKADGVSLHTYDFKADPRRKRRDRDDWTQGNLGYARSDLRKAARTKRLPAKAARAIHLTEFAYKTTGSDRISTSRARTYLKRAWSIARRQKVRSFVWYQLRDPQSTGESWQSGLKTRDGGTRSTWTTFRGLR
ncbi:hypothetical protein [Patulibacter sp.]|uniref:hypothetical protein n=1 Tax=Patulibacter sp. TaxID=1912859 RepID=UPI00271FDC6D|nr:hypothetical protein [Patulibacter sp.]MDO9410614.1 hypothetical protein [Patulibacter sp.]